MVGPSAPGRVVSDWAAAAGSASRAVAVIRMRCFMLKSILDSAVRRVVAPNPGVMTGPGTNTYLVGIDELIVIEPGPDDESHMQAILEAAGTSVRWILYT